MNIFKSLIQSIKLKLYLRIAKRNLQLIQYFEKQKTTLNEIMTTYTVEDKLVELKSPVYNYYKACFNISLSNTLEHEILESNIPEGEEVKTIKNPMEITSEGYYCIVNKTEENFAMIDGAKHPLEQLAAGLPYTEIYSDKDEYENGYYKKYTISRKYYHAVKEIILTELQLTDIPEEEKFNIKLVDDTSYIDKEGYYKVVV